MMQDKQRALRVLILNTFAFTVCFAAWMMNGVLITFLVDNGVYQWDKAQLGWLIGIPVLTGSITRLPVGVLTDKYGGRKVYAALMLLAAFFMFMVSYADSYSGFLLAGLGFGVSGASFAVGIAYTSVWFPPQYQGTALGVFGAGNAGAALTSIFAPMLLKSLTNGGENLEGWRTMPRIYAALLLGTALLFWFLTYEKKVVQSKTMTLAERLSPLRHMRVWRFGLYYFLVFGGFVALAQWLIPYYVNVYSMSVATAGLLASIFSFPSGVIRAVGGWMSDKFGARSVMYWVLGTIAIASALLSIPRMDLQSPGAGVMAKRPGIVTEVASDKVVIGDQVYKLIPPATDADWKDQDGFQPFPKSRSWQVPAVKVGDKVKKKELVARGVTYVHFQSNVWIFTCLVFVVGIAMGIGKAAVYKHIPDYFPNEVGVVGGMVGVLGGLGGFVCPIIFGYLLKGTGIWSTCWVFFLILTIVCLVWMHLVIRKMLFKRAPRLARQIEDQAADVFAHGEED